MNVATELARRINAITWESLPPQVVAKFESGAARVLPEASVARLYAGLHDLQNVGSVRELIPETRVAGT